MHLNGRGHLTANQMAPMCDPVEAGVFVFYGPVTTICSRAVVRLIAIGCRCVKQIIIKIYEVPYEKNLSPRDPAHRREGQ